MSRLSKQNSAWLLIGAGFLLYAAAFIIQSSVIVGGERVFTLFDDGMISMRYARNLAHGAGLVWNPGEAPVEGYTNPLWVLYMAAWHLLPIPATLISAIIQASGAVCLLANLVCVRRIAGLLAPGVPAVAVGAVLLTASYYPLINWSLQGMEVGLLTLLIGAAVWLALRGLARQRVEVGVYLLLGLGTLVRPDGVVPLAAVFIFLLIADRANRRAHLLYGLGTAILFVGGQTLFRLAYYGDPLPNTYYLKMTGYPTLLRIGRGAVVFLRFVLDLNFFVLLVALVGLIARRDRGALLLGWVSLAMVSYSVYVGGDAWEWFGGSNRYISPAMPLLILLLSAGLVRTLQQLAADLGQPDPLPQAAARRILNGLLLLILLVGSSLYAFLSIRPVEPTSILGLVAGGVAGGVVALAVARRVRRRPLRPIRWIPVALASLIVVSAIDLNAARPADPADATARWLLLQAPPQGADNGLLVQRAQILSRVTTAQARIAVVTAGTLPYFLDRPAIDLLGKSDRHIAHEPMKPALEAAPVIQFWPGHMKWDYAYSIGQLAPDVVTQFWPSTDTLDRVNLQDVPPDAQPYIAAAYTRAVLDGIPFDLRRGSANIRWDLIAREAGR
jgi:hypothetical protein